MVIRLVVAGEFMCAKCLARNRSPIHSTLVDDRDSGAAKLVRMETAHHLSGIRASAEGILLASQAMSLLINRTHCSVRASDSGGGRGSQEKA